jgi:hypothetical protein
MLAAAIAAPNISFDAFAMISFSWVNKTMSRRRLDYIAANSITLS